MKLIELHNYLVMCPEVKVVVFYENIKKHWNGTLLPKFESMKDSKTKEKIDEIIEVGNKMIKDIDSLSHWITFHRNKVLEFGRVVACADLIADLLEKEE